MDNIVSNVCVKPSDGISDHNLIVCDIKCSKPPASKLLVSHRDTKKINLEDLRDDIQISLQSMNVSDDATDLTAQYNNMLSSLFNRYAPEKKRLVTLRPHAPWYDDSLRKAKQQKRRLERKYRSTGLEIHRQMFGDACKKYKDMLTDSKTKYYTTKISGSDQRQLFKMVSQMFLSKKAAPLPKHSSLELLVEEFNNFFTEKVQAIRSGLDADSSNLNTTGIQEASAGCSSSFNEFLPVTSTTVRKTVMKSPTKSCQLDPIPTSVVKQIPMLIPVITKIINASVNTGEFPSQLKSSLVRPTLKKPDMDHDSLASYRPISNLSFLSKTIERTVSSQTYSYLERNELFPMMQSAYRQHHSTETALLKVSNDILRAVDQHQDVVLVMLDLSAAFDTIDHTILLERMKQRFGFGGVVIKWFASYLSSRKQSVMINECVSHSKPIKYGVPQGSVLGPLLFAMYMAPIEDIVRFHGLSCMVYADDSQFYVMLNPSDPSPALEKLKTCINSVMSWNKANKLQCNPDKTEIIHFTSRFLKNQPIAQVNIGGGSIDVVKKVRNLGVVFDSTLNYRAQVNSICKSSSLAIRNIGRVRKYLAKDQLERIIHAFVTSRIDYCNSLLFGLPSCDIDKIQRLQNTAARLLVGAGPRDRISPILKDLHWLRVRERVEFKVLLITYKALHNMAPSYISNMLAHYNPTRTLRSSTKFLLDKPSKIKTVTYGKRAFSVAAPNLWNTLPEYIRTAESVERFKVLLKTYFFSLSHK